MGIMFRADRVLTLQPEIVISLVKA